MKRRIFIRALIAIAVTLAASSSAWAQDQAVDTKASELYDEVMSPFCPGRTLANCPSPQAAQLREQIKQRLAAGSTDEQIKEELYEAYGEVVLGAPRKEGFGLLAYILPALFILLGAVALAYWITSMKRAPAARAVVEDPLDSQARARLESELSRL
jgi:cytochrome c-type biogenesis protein CcmH